jgi:putative ABC transport system permease protein
MGRKNQEKDTGAPGQALDRIPMSMLSRTALANFKKNKSRNILIGAALVMTAMLLTAVLTVIIGVVDIQEQAARNNYPTFHAMFGGVDGETARAIKKDEMVEQAGFREDAALMHCDDKDVSISMLSIDRTAAELARQELSGGRMPEAADEIVVSEGVLKALKLEGTIGDRIEITAGTAGNGLLERREFTIVGMVEDNETSVREGTYFAFVSDAFAGEILPEHMREYRIYLRLGDVQGMVTDEIEEQIRILGKQYGIEEKNILVNGTYLSATYVDPATYKTLGVIMAVISLVGALTIYSIYYVSMLDKVQEYGKLRAIGATKRQIRKLVFREGFAVAAATVPIGIVLGILTGILVVFIATDISAGNGDAMYDQMKLVLERHEVRLVKPWIIVCGAAVSLFTVYLSLLGPMNRAGRISAIEAIRFQGEDKSKKQSRKGYEEIGTGRLALTNLNRNKKRTAVTVFALGATGCLFMVVATVCSCMDPEVMARQEIRGDIQISIDAYGDDAMFPERSLRKIQQNNPLTQEMQRQVKEVSGVRAVEADRRVSAGVIGLEKEKDGRPFQTEIVGVCSEAMEKLTPYVIEGTLEDPALLDGRGIIVGKHFREAYAGAMGWEVGASIQAEVADGEKDVRMEFRIAAVVDAPSSLCGSYLSMPADTLQSLCETEVTDCLEIMVEDGKEDGAASEIRRITEGQEFLEMRTFHEVYEEEERGVKGMRYVLYGLILIFGLIGILNLVNTMINSVYVRRRELGVLQAIGMSKSQMLHMLQMEGLFYTAGTLVVSLGLGSMLGYAVFLWAKEEGIMSIQLYQYPAVQALILLAVVFSVQFLITYLVSRNFRKQSLIERIRLAE